MNVYEEFKKYLQECLELGKEVSFPEFKRRFNFTEYHKRVVDELELEFDMVNKTPHSMLGVLDSDRLRRLNSYKDGLKMLDHSEDPDELEESATDIDKEVDDWSPLKE